MILKILRQSKSPNLNIIYVNFIAYFLTNKKKRSEGPLPRILDERTQMVWEGLESTLIQSVYSIEWERRGEERVSQE